MHLHAIHATGSAPLLPSLAPTASSANTPCALPAGYAYASDAGATYSALLRYSTSVLSAFYRTRFAMAADKQLQVIPWWARKAGGSPGGCARARPCIRGSAPGVCSLTHLAAVGVYTRAAGLPSGPRPRRPRRHPRLPRRRHHQVGRRAGQDCCAGGCTWVGGGLMSARVHAGGADLHGRGVGVWSTTERATRLSAPALATAAPRRPNGSPAHSTMP